jgi:hypothetical protein
MTARNVLTATVGLASLAALAGCTTLARPSTTPAAAPPVSFDSESESDHNAVETSNAQMFNAEHANDPDGGTVSNPNTQGIP